MSCHARAWLVVLAVAACGSDDAPAVVVDAAPGVIDAAPGASDASAACGNCDDGDDCTADRCLEGGCVNLSADHCGTPGCALAECAGDDTDGDGLSDAWEQQGYVDVNCNGVNDGEPTDVDLSGADPYEPDIFVEIDYLEKAGAGNACDGDGDCTVDGERCLLDDEGDPVCTHSHRPSPGALDAVIVSLSAHDINLHIDQHMDRIPEVDVVSFGTNAIDLEDRELAPACVGTDDGFTAAHFFDLKDTYSSPARQRVYHYALYVHHSSCPPDPDFNRQYCNACPENRGGGFPTDGATGSAELLGNDLMVSLGDAYFSAGVIRHERNEGGTFLHELGHNLGLQHAGDAPAPEFSPNYFSVMNYLYQLNGVPFADAPGSTTIASRKIELSDRKCPTLDESALVEGDGIACGSNRVARFFNELGPALASASDGTPVDWDGKNDAVDTDNPINTDPVPVDLNNDDQLNPAPTSIHASFDDYAHLQLDHACQDWTVEDGLAPQHARAGRELSARDGRPRRSVPALAAGRRAGATPR